MSFYDDFPPFRFRDRTNNFVNDFRNEFENSRNNMWGDNFGTFFSPRHSDLRSRMAQHRPEFFQTPKPATSAAASASSSAAASPGPSEFSGERVIPIHICTEDERAGTRPTAWTADDGRAPSTSSNNAAEESLKSYAPQRNNTAEIPRVKEISRNQRAQSAPPSGAGIHVNQCGGGQSKKGNQSGREIPIQIEIKNSSAKGPSAGPKTGTSSSPATKTAAANKGKGEPSNAAPASSEQDSKPTPPKKPLVLDPMDKIRAVAEQVRELAEKVNAFTKSQPEKDYLYLDEMLTRCLIQLDDVEVEGKDDLRQARREVIKSIQKCIADLEKRAGKQPASSDITEEAAACGEAPMAEDAGAAGDAASVVAKNPAQCTEQNLSSSRSSTAVNASESAADHSKDGQVEPMAVDQQQPGDGDHALLSQNANPQTKESSPAPSGNKTSDDAKEEKPPTALAGANQQEPEKMET